jgi:hypothetical protein
VSVKSSNTVVGTVSLSRTLKEKMSAIVGVPLRTPLEVSKLIPGGNDDPEVTFQV